ncbi:hypothetical protein SPSF3K_00713 [Streptococcus parauberis]|uniref:Uncharacterized protein n=1 Tax=Streptococcus parauberis KRS-02083 TaxID=1207545 RepID=A0ABN0IUK1_9STRE|nr:hypothetical protein [Streptococcus parauberis]QBX09850.1 hypothetical protein JavanS391_0016 [Streptococcus satellite phage Javan391]QBX09884.1 hypothetical protein JavanS396_0006 [Streptococcus satellite phage Javan396]AUT05440.1 hypothetical protein SPSF3K_00713 [Streptococcus parauberis]EMG26540.1 hypothetical protein SPJ1_0502 [Streptococcus parauberis KRS-02083]UWV10886.1 hypothetical protein N2A95_03590 [Streptococcus parauberis]
MAYLPEERETVIIYDEQSNSWQFESNVRRHITKIMKTPEAFDVITKELDGTNCISVRATLSNLDDFSVNPFVKNKRKMTDKQKQEMADRLKRNLSRN